jgi:hypothetical protein
MNFFIFIVEKIITRIFNMAIKNTETKNDRKDKISVVEIIQDIDYRLTHLEDMQADNRELMAKLVKQGNTIVEFLKQFNVEEIDPEDLEIGIGLPPLPDPEERMSRTAALKDIIDDILERHQDLKEFEDELKKHKDKITPGQVGET